MNPRGPYLTLTLSPPIGWERRGDSKRMPTVAWMSSHRRRVQGSNARILLGKSLHEPERCRLPDGRTYQPACRRGVRRQPRTFSGDAALGKARDVWEDLEMRKWIPARKRCQPHSPPATALHDAIALKGAFRRFMVPMRGKKAAKASQEPLKGFLHPATLSEHRRLRDAIVPGFIASAFC